MKQRDASAGLDMYELARGGGQMKVIHQTQEMRSGDDHAMHLIWIVERWCTACGRIVVFRAVTSCHIFED